MIVLIISFMLFIYDCLNYFIFDEVIFYVKYLNDSSWIIYTSGDKVIMLNKI